MAFPNRGRTKQERNEQNEPRGGGRWFAYDLSHFITGRWAANMSRLEGSMFWVKIVCVPDMKEIALKHARDIIIEADKAGMEYSEAIGIMTRALETVKNEQEVTDAATPLLDQWVAPQEDPIAPALPNPFSITGPADLAPTVPGTDENNEMSCSVDGMVGVADTDMVGAYDDEAVTPDNPDAFDKAFPNNEDMVSLKMCFCMK